MARSLRPTMSGARYALAVCDSFHRRPYETHPNRTASPIWERVAFFRHALSSTFRLLTNLSAECWRPGLITLGKTGSRPHDNHHLFPNGWCDCAQYRRCRGKQAAGFKRCIEPGLTTPAHGNLSTRISPHIVTPRDRTSLGKKEKTWLPLPQI